MRFGRMLPKRLVRYIGGNDSGMKIFYILLHRSCVSDMLSDYTSVYLYDHTKC